MHLHVRHAEDETSLTNEDYETQFDFYKKFSEYFYLL